MAIGIDPSGTESEEESRALLQRSYDAGIYQLKIWSSGGMGLRNLRRGLRAEMTLPNVGSTPPLRSTSNGIQMPGDLWSDMIAVQGSVLGACRSDKNLIWWTEKSRNCRLFEREMGIQTPNTETETIVSVGCVICWLQKASQPPVADITSIDRRRTIGKAGEHEFVRKLIRRPIWAQTHKPRFKTDLTNAELGDLISRAVSIWGSGSESEEGRGGDYLAWYLPFHNDTQNWGVHIPVTGLLKCARDIAPSGFTGSWLDIVELALQGLLAHELIHYAVEYRSAQLEYLMEEHCYLASRTALNEGTKYVPFEERLAEGAFLRSIRNQAAARNLQSDVYECAISWIKSKKLSGYRDGGKSVATRDFLDNANMLMRRVAEELPKENAQSATHPMDFGAQPAATIDRSTMVVLNGSQCPIYLVRDEEVLGVLPGTIEVA